MNDEIMMFGIPLAKVTEAEAVERIVEFARKGRASRGHKQPLTNHEPLATNH